MIISLVRNLRRLLPGALPAIAVIGPGAAKMAACLRAFGYEQIWQRDEADAVFSLYQPGRLFDAIVLADCLQMFCNPEQSRKARAFDQIDASLADRGFLCVSVVQSEFTADSLIELLAGHGFSNCWIRDRDPLEEVGAVPRTEPARLVGIFERRKEPQLDQAKRDRALPGLGLVDNAQLRGNIGVSP